MERKQNDAGPAGQALQLPDLAAAAKRIDYDKLADEVDSIVGTFLSAHEVKQETLDLVISV